MEFQNMMAFIHENYARKLTLEDIAQAGLIGKIDILAAYAGGTFDGNPNLTQQEVLEKTTAVNQCRNIHVIVLSFQIKCQSSL